MRVDLRDKINESFAPMFSSHVRDLVVYGGAGAGKSWAVAQKVILKCYKYPKRKVVIIRKYGPSLRRTAFDLVCNLLEEYGLPHKTNRTEMVIGFPNKSQMLFIPIVDSAGTREPGERIKSLTDITDIWFEEPTELSYKEYQQASLRLRGQELSEGYRQRIYSFNPIDKNHWLYRHFFDGARGDRQKYTYRDNRFIEAEYIKELEALKEIDPVAYQVYALGEWGVMGNQIYTNYEVAEFELDFNNLDALIAGCDFGFDPSPYAWIPIGIKENTLFVRTEIYQKKLTTGEFISLIKDSCEFLNLSPSNLATYCDSSEPARIQEMENEGLLVYPAEKKVTDGIAKVKTFHIVIHPDCVHTIKEIAGYKLREDRHGNVLEQPVKFNDHTMDAIRYAVYTYHLGAVGAATEYEIEPYPDVYEREGRF